MCLCVSVCVYVQALNFRILWVIVIVRDVACWAWLGTGLGVRTDSAQGLFHTVSCLQGWTLHVDRPTRCCLLVMYLLYFRKAPSRHAFQLLLLIHSA